MFNRRSRSKDRARPAAAAEDRPPIEVKTPPIKPFRRAEPTVPAAPLRAAPPAIAVPKPAPAPIPARPAQAPCAKAPPASTGRMLLVGQGIRLSGEIGSCERLVVAGTVEGDLCETQTLEIAETGRFKGAAVAEDCIVDGVFEGDLVVRGVLSLGRTGRVAGTVRYGEIEIARGGKLFGNFGPPRTAEGATTLRPAPDLPTEAPAVAASNGGAPAARSAGSGPRLA